MQWNRKMIRLKNNLKQRNIIENKSNKCQKVTPDKGTREDRKIMRQK